MLKNENKTGDRINELIQDRGILKKHFAVDMGVTQQAVSAWISNKSMPAPEMIKKIAGYFGVYPEYLTGEKDYKNFDDMLLNNADKSLLQFVALQDLFKSYGYNLRAIHSFKSDSKYARMFSDIPNDAIYDFNGSGAIRKITTPDGKTKYIDNDALKQLVTDFFILVDSRLSDKTE